MFDWVTVVEAWQLDYLIETDMVELASLLVVDPITVTMPPAILHAFPLPIAVLSPLVG